MSEARDVRKALTNCLLLAAVGVLFVGGVLPQLRGASTRSIRQPSVDEITPAMRQAIPVRMGEAEFRKMAITHPRPAFPSGARRKGIQERVVALVTSGLEGSVEAVDVIDSPDQILSEAVRVAVTTWTFYPSEPFNPAGERERRRVTSKLTFYFVSDSSGGTVWNPAELAERLAQENGTTQSKTTTIVDGLQDLANGKEREIVALNISEQTFGSTRIQGFRQIDIPVDELGLRLLAEVEPVGQLAVMCGSVETERCRTLSQDLYRFGFDEIFVIPGIR